MYHSNSNLYTRRNFIYDLSFNVGFAALAINGMTAITGCANNEQKSEEKSKNEKSENKLGIALVGLGGYSSGLGDGLPDECLN